MKRNLFYLMIASAFLLFQAGFVHAETNGSPDEMNAGIMVASDKKAPDFSFPAFNSTKNLGPADFKGHYLLIDFWASWCPPCNASTPIVKELYETYKAKGFKVLGVSIDTNQQAWEKKIEDKQMNWDNVLAPGGGKEISQVYQFSAIPYFVLVDPEGNIIVAYQSIKEAAAKVESVFK